MTTLRLTYVPMENSEHVYLNGVEQQFDIDYEFSDPGVIVTTSAMATESDDLLECYYAHQGVEVPPPDEPTIVGNLIHLDYDYSFWFVLPSGIQVGDLMVILTYHWHGMHLVDGFMDWYPNDGLGVRSNRLQAKFIDTEVAGDAIEVLVGSGFRGAGIMQIIRGVDQSDPLEDLSLNTAPSIGSVTTTSDARKVVHMAVRYQGPGPVDIDRGTTTVSEDDGSLGAEATQEYLAAETTVNAGIANGFGASVVLRSD